MVINSVKPSAPCLSSVVPTEKLSVIRTPSFIIKTRANIPPHTYNLFMKAFSFSLQCRCISGQVRKILDWNAFIFYCLHDPKLFTLAL